MPQKLGILAMMTLAYVGVFYYICCRLCSMFKYSVNKILILVIGFVIGLVSALTIWYTGQIKILIIIGTFMSWLYVLNLLFFVFLLIENIVEIRYKPNHWIVLGIFVAILGIGNYFSLVTKIINLDIETDKIEEDTKILLVSDVHVDYVFYKFHVKKIIQTIEKEKPDFVIIAGDLLNRPSEDYLKVYSQYFKKNQITTPVLAIVGNHDVMGDDVIIKKLSNMSSIKLLQNETINLNGIQIVGILDKSIRNGRDLNDVLEESNMDNNQNIFTILVTHQPIGFEKLQDYEIDLEVAGHTHRGQVFGLRKLVEWVNDYGYGEYNYNGRTAFVSQGLGTWALPVRLGTQSEMVLINLKKK